jgi:hypothetical protein
LIGTSIAIVQVADLTKGVEGLHEIFPPLDDRLLTVVVRGRYEADGRIYGMVRTMWWGDAGRNSQRTELQVIRHSSARPQCERWATPYHNECPWCP